MIAIKNGKIITATGVLDNQILIIDKDRIQGIFNTLPKIPMDQVIDAHHHYIAPGFIDIHNDKIEQFICPRPTSIMNFDLAMNECERELLLQGITTIYHSLALFKDNFFGTSPLRTKENVMKLADLIQKRFEQSNLIRHRFHLRIEIDNLDAYDIAKTMILNHKVHEISFMDHTPGQGQYKNLEIYEKTISSYKGKEIETLGFDGVLNYHENKQTLSFEQLKELTELAHQNKITVASHDDDSLEKLMLNKKINVDISEFPITLEAAKHAKKLGFKTVAGAPNILLGGSHSGNMNASHAILENCIDILCSDYYPAAMLHSVFIMNQKEHVPLHEMINKVALNPASAMNINEDYGSIEIGKKADLLLINFENNFPVINQIFVDGKIVSTIEYRK
ncbi:MAG: alpha-D-ribose 1-methylphosphonate 5-triphosphate diphosphatase [Fibrobacteraceae bacterium]